MKKLLPALLLLLLVNSSIYSTLIIGNSSNYTGLISTLQPGDILYLQAGTYTSGLTLSGLMGTAVKPIVITGDTTAYTTIFEGRSCCNTVSITQSAYIVIKNLKLDGKSLDVDAVKGEGTTGNWAHHITIANLYITNHDNDQQDVGISTKCTAWDWVIRGNTIASAGTGLYLGNSDGTAPFVNGLIENNLVMNTVGYNMEIKQQNDGLRTIAGMTLNGKTIIRYNVWSKELNASTGGNARPNVLVDHFPTTGNGANDYYEMYGNLFYQNPVEALLQATGNVILYENIFINHLAPAGLYAVVINNHNGFASRDIKVFHNTVWTNSTSGGIVLSSPDVNYQQYCYANAVFAVGTPINGFTIGNKVDNVTDTYANASTYVVAPSTTLTSCNMYPKAGQLTGTTTASTLFTSYTAYGKDFNADNYNWTYRGAYSGSVTNKGWQLKLAIMPTPTGTLTGITEQSNDISGVLYPNPASNNAELQLLLPQTFNDVLINIMSMDGSLVKTVYHGTLVQGENKLTLPLNEISRGIYILSVQAQEYILNKKIILNK
jgi:hypothetical protein